VSRVSRVLEVKFRFRLRIDSCPRTLVLRSRMEASLSPVIWNVFGTFSSVQLCLGHPRCLVCFPFQILCPGYIPCALVRWLDLLFGAHGTVVLAATFMFFTSAVCSLLVSFQQQVSHFSISPSLVAHPAPQAATLVESWCSRHRISA
jgi:hypothetical protein